LKSLLRAYAIGQRGKGLIVEFGVNKGRTVNFFAERVDDVVHGFDSFEGLPESWKGNTDTSNAWRNQGQLPEVRKNVKLHTGWFNETLPGFLETHKDNFGFMHVDCDIYSSTKTIFDFCASRIVPGTIILFDEYFNFPFWQEHEFKAFQEFVQDNNVNFQYIGVSGVRVGVKILP
jgi:hypothetical protein